MVTASLDWVGFVAPEVLDEEPPFVEPPLEPPVVEAGLELPVVDEPPAPVTEAIAEKRVELAKDRKQRALTEGEEDGCVWPACVPDSARRKCELDTWGRRCLKGSMHYSPKL